MQAGFARQDITPNAGDIIPGQWLVRYAEGVRDRLFVRALAFEHEGARAALVSSDVCFVPPETVAAVREELSARLGLAPEHLWLHATHTHTGPPVAEGLGSPSDPRAVARLGEACIAAVVEAFERLEPAELAWATTRAEGLAFSRRYWLERGEVVMHPSGQDPELLRPEGVPDEALVALGIYTPGARLPRIVAINFACHPIVVGGDTLYSGDYPGALCRAAEGLLGCEALYVNGFCADVGPDDVDSPVSGYGAAAMERMGVALATRAAEALLEAPRSAAGPLGGEILHRDLRVRVPDPAVVARAREVLGDDLSTIPQDVELIKLRELLLLAREVEESPLYEAQVSVLRIGEGVLVGWPGEVFSAYGRRLRRLSQGSPLMLGCLVNGVAGYMPTREAFLGGGYETWLCRTSRLEEGAADILLSATRDMLRG